MYRLAHVEDNADIRQSVQEAFSSSKKIVLDFATDSFEKAIIYYRSRKPPQVMLLDINLAGLSGIEGLPLLRRHFPDCEIVMHTILDDDDKIFQAICNGASGYLLKMTPYEDLETHLLNTLEAKGSAITPSIARRILHYFTPVKPARKEKEETETLSETERTIVQLLMDALSYQQISDKLGMTIDGVRYYVKRIYTKLQVKTRNQLTAKYQKSDWQI